MKISEKRNAQDAVRKVSFYKSRAFFLIVFFIIIQILNCQLSPYYWDANGLLGATNIFLDKGFLVLGMSFVLMIGEIDISVASIIALVSSVMGLAFQSGVPLPLAIILGLCTGGVCGLINGLIIAKFRELASMIVTLATMSLYRGTAWILLGDKGVSGYPDWFAYLADGTLFSLGNIKIPFMLIMFMIAAFIFCFALHKTAFGKKLYMVGNNADTARYSGIQVDKIRIFVFVLNGLMAAVAAIFLTSRVLSSKPNMAMGYEMEAIAIIVLGGIKTSGGVGDLFSVILSIFTVGYIRYGLGLKSISSTVILIVIGLLLIFSILMPNIAGDLKAKSEKKKVQSILWKEN